jgi:hypothetical protein
MGDVLGDHALAAELRTLEQRQRASEPDEIVREIVAAIRARYDFVEDAGAVR